MKTKKRLLFIAVPILISVAGAFVLFRSVVPKPIVQMTLRSFTNGDPSWKVHGWFIDGSPPRAQLMQNWLQAGTNSVVFAITNKNAYGLRLRSVAEFETADGRRYTPILNTRNNLGDYIEPGGV